MDFSALDTGITALDNPLASATSVNKPKMSQGLSTLFSNKNFTKFLAELGASADPNGAGGIIGRPAAQLAERLAMGDSLNKIGKSQKKLLPFLLQALLGDTPLSEINFDEGGNVKGIKADTTPRETPAGEASQSDEEDLLDSAMSKYFG